MKKLTVFIAAILMFSLFTVQVSASGKGEKSTTKSSEQSASQSKQTQTANTNAPYTGNGGKGMSLAIISPKGSGLTTAFNYIPDLVQGEFVSNFSNFSAISVLDRISLDKVIAETLDPTYKDNLDIVRLGHVTQTDYIMTGTVTKTTSNYALQIQITSTADGMTKASYSGTCTVDELDNLIGIRRASLELFPQMGVILKEDAKDRLSNAGHENYVNAQTALAQGLVAQRNGNTIESLAKFYQANSYDPSFKEAATRVNTLSATIRTGSNIEDIRNDLAWRNEWRKLINEGQEWFKKQPRPIEYIEYDDFSRHTRLVYDPELSYKVNYDNDTMTYTYNVMIERLNPKRPSPPDYIKKVEADLIAGLEATGRNGDWKLNVGRYNWGVHDWQMGSGYAVWPKDTLYLYTADLYNDKGKKLKSNSFFIVTKNPNYTVNFTPIRGTLPNNTKMIVELKETLFLTDEPKKNSERYYNDREHKYEEYPVINILISRGNFNNINLDKTYREYRSSEYGPFKDTQGRYYFDFLDKKYYIKGKFSNIKVDDVTDTMTIKITNIYEFEFRQNTADIDMVSGKETYSNSLTLLRQGTDIISVNTGKVSPAENSTLFYCYEY